MGESFAELHSYLATLITLALIGLSGLTIYKVMDIIKVTILKIISRTGE